MHVQKKYNLRGFLNAKAAKSSVRDLRTNSHLLSNLESVRLHLCSDPETGTSASFSRSGDSLPLSPGK